VVPSYHNHRLLEEHLQKLSIQTFRDFDVLVIYGEDDQFINTAGPVSIVHIRRRWDIGCAGAFYLGESYAISEGYRYIVLADNDCYPESETLLDKIVEGLERNDVVYPPIHVGVKRERIIGPIHQYWGVRREVLERTGLTFLPLYFGGEDFDLMRRIREKGFRISPIDATATHPAGKPFGLESQSRLHHYTRGSIIHMLLAGAYAKAFISIFGNLMAAVSFLLLGNPLVAERCIRTVWSASDIRLFKEEWTVKFPAVAARDDEGGGIEPDVMVGVESKTGNVMKQMDSLPSWTPAGKTVQLSIRRLLHVISHARHLGKRMMFVDGCSRFDIPLLLFARSAHLKTADGIYRITRDRGFIALVLGLVVFAAAIPLAAVLALMLTARGVINLVLKGIDSRGYGIEGC
jgi:hypothetical protein